MATYFCDGIKQVTILNGVARLEFCRLPNPSGPGQDIQPVTELILALPPQGLMQLLSVLERIRDQLVDDRSSHPTTGEVAPQTKTAPNHSPNFPEAADD
jgi:hypothetical protein